jgi:hypothetical protein
MTKRSALLYLVLPLLAAGIALLVIGASMHVRAADGHAPSRFHRVYPPATQHARDWLWRGLGDREWACLDAIGHYESGWRVRAGTPTGSYGLFQAFPGKKMAKYGADWLTNPMTQARFGLAYAKSRYGSPCKAWQFWQSHGWW